MPNENMANRVNVKLLTVPANKTGTVTSSACDTQGYQGVLFCVVYGASGDTLAVGTTSWTAKLQSCATEAGTYADVAAGDVLGASANSFGLYDLAGENTDAFGLSYVGTNRYVKVVVTAAGTMTNGTPMSIIAVLLEPRTPADEMKVNP